MEDNMNFYDVSTVPMDPMDNLDFTDCALDPMSSLSTDALYNFFMTNCYIFQCPYNLYMYLFHNHY